MRSLSPIYWHEGLFLRPHHLQQQDHCHGDRLGVHLELLNRFHWGVVALDIERTALRNRSVEVSRCALVFPSGEVAWVPENAQVDSRSFADHLPPAGQPLEVYLGLPRTRANEPNYAGADASADEVFRYRLRTREITDEVSGERASAVQFAIANLRVLFGSDDRGAFECIKVAEVFQKGAEMFEVSSTYIPPCLRIDSNAELERLCKQVRDSFLSTAREIHGQKRERVDLDPGYAVRLVAVNSFVSRIVHLVASGNVHPFDFYTELASAAGALSSFKPQEEAWDLAPYIHENLYPSFRNTVGKIVEYLEQYVAPRNYIEVRLNWVAADNCYQAALTGDHFREGSRYCLYFAGEQQPDVVREEVNRVKVRVGSSERIKELNLLHLRGVLIRPLDAPLQGLPLRPAAMFHVDAAGAEWEKVKEAKKLSVYLPGLSDLTVSLFVVKS